MFENVNSIPPWLRWTVVIVCTIIFLGRLTAWGSDLGGYQICVIVVVALFIAFIVWHAKKQMKDCDEW